MRDIKSGQRPQVRRGGQQNITKHRANIWWVIQRLRGKSREVRYKYQETTIKEQQGGGQPNEVPAVVQLNTQLPPPPFFPSLSRTCAGQPASTTKLCLAPMLEIARSTRPVARADVRNRSNGSPAALPAMLCDRCRAVSEAGTAGRINPKSSAVRPLAVRSATTTGGHGSRVCAQKGGGGHGARYDAHNKANACVRVSRRCAYRER